MNNKAILVTGHSWGSKRRAGFHWIGATLAQMGWDVLFLTAGLSEVSRLRNDYRLTTQGKDEFNKVVLKEPGIWGFVFHSAWHPVNLHSRLANQVMAPFFRTYGLGDWPYDLKRWIEGAELMIFESGPGLMFFERMKAANPKARMVYRVSDDLRFLRPHPVIVEAETRICGKFDLVSVPTQSMTRIFGPHVRVKCQYHGIEKAIFDQEAATPYGDRPGTHAVFAGNSFFDFTFLDLASSLLPKVTFHLFGPLEQKCNRPNVVYYGEVPFLTTVPYLKHADVGLQMRSWSPGAESLADSLKVLQYTYCRLPIVAPDFMSVGKGHVMDYLPGNRASILAAMEAAIAYDHAQVPAESIWDWKQLTQALL